MEISHYLYCSPKVCRALIIIARALHLNFLSIRVLTSCVCSRTPLYSGHRFGRLRRLMRFGLPVNSRLVSLALVRLVVSCRRTAEGLRRGAAETKKRFAECLA